MMNLTLSREEMLQVFYDEYKAVMARIEVIEEEIENIKNSMEEAQQ